MRTLISSAFVSLDGVVDSPGGGTPSESHRSGGWTFKDIDFLPEVYELKGREMEEAAAMLFGRVSYEAFAPVWPGMTEFAVVKDIPKYVVSSTTISSTTGARRPSSGRPTTSAHSRTPTGARS